MFIKEKINELQNFNAFLFKFNGKEMIIKLKKTSYKQFEYMFNYIKNYKGEKQEELIDLLECIIDKPNREYLTIIVNNTDLLVRFIKIIFSETNFNTNFIELSILCLKESMSSRQDMFTKFIKTLLMFGYRLIDLKDMTQIEIVDLAIKELLYRNPPAVYSFFEEECFNEDTKEVIEGREELYEYIKSIKSELVPEEKPKSVDTNGSAWDQLNSL